MRSAFGDSRAARGLILRSPPAPGTTATGCAGVDVDHHAHARAQQMRDIAFVEGDAHRHALHHLDPIAGGVLRRQDRELRAGAGADRNDRALEGVVGEAVDRDGHLLPDAQIGDVGFLRIGLDPGIMVVDHAQHRRAGGEEAAELDIVHLRGGARHRRAHDGVVEIALGVVERGLGLRVFGELLERQLGIAEQLAQGRIALLLGELRLQLRRHQSRHGGVDIGLRAGAAREQLALAVDVALLERDVLLRQVGERGQRAERALGLVVVAARGRELGLCLLHRQPVGLGIERE